MGRRRGMRLLFHLAIVSHQAPAERREFGTAASRPTEPSGNERRLKIWFNSSISSQARR